LRYCKTPLIVAVPEFEFERWTQFYRGMTVRVECTLDSVLDWSRRVSSSKPSDDHVHDLALELVACAEFHIVLLSWQASLEGKPQRDIGRNIAYHGRGRTMEITTAA
jgi:hypothetical protein